MFKKIIQLFSKGESSGHSATETKDMEQPASHPAELQSSADELNKIGNQHLGSGDLIAAEFHYKQALDLDPSLAAAYANLGIVRYNQGKLDEAISYYDQAIALKDDFPEAYSNRGLALNNLNRPDEALISLDRAIELKPDFTSAHNNRGMALKNLNRLEEALLSYGRAIEQKPNFAQAYNNRGNVLKSLDRLKEALVSFNNAIKLNPVYAEAYFNRGEVQYSLKRYKNALKGYDSAIELSPQFADAHSNRALPLINLTQYDAALTSIDLAIKLKPDSAMAYNNKGLVLGAQNKFEEAIVSYRHAIALKPDCHEAYSNLGETLSRLRRYEEALVSFDKCISLKPGYVEAHIQRAEVLKSLKRPDDALKSYEHAITLKPDRELLYGSWFEAKKMLCDWANYEGSVKALEHKINNGKNCAASFAVLSQTYSADLQRKAAVRYGQDFALKAKDPLPARFKHPRHDKIRIGYFSADFCNHAVSILTAELFERHDKSKFELVAFSLSDIKDDMTKRIVSAFDHFTDVSKQSDKEVALMARELEIDIAIDLGGFTGECRTGIFALRAAPVQVNYLGYPGTMGADYMDYIIADATLIPSTHQQYYSEKVAYLPSFQVNDTKRIISDRKFTREELGLPSTGVVFCCFNNIPKINPAMFDTWMCILKKVEGSVLWMLGENATAVNNLRKEAAARGVNSNRIIFAKRETLPDYLARYRMADLFLDTLPFNAGTTASDALWAGLPVITQIGESFAGRMAASLLNAIQLPELITTTQEDYETLAVELAKNPDKLSEIKQKLAKNRLTTPLFDIDYFTKHIEAAYAQMYKRYQAGLEPDHINTLQKLS